MEIIFVDSFDERYLSITRVTTTYPTEDEVREEVESFQKYATEENRWDCPPFDLEKPIYVYCNYLNNSSYTRRCKVRIFQKVTAREYLKSKS